MDSALSLDTDEVTTNDIVVVCEGMDYVHGQWAKTGLIQLSLENDPTCKRIDIKLPNGVPTGHSDRVIRHLLQYLEYHSLYPESTIAKPLLRTLKASGVSEWDEAFINKSDEEIVELTLVASYMDVPALLSLCCAQMGMIMKNIMKQHDNKADQIKAVRARWYGDATTDAVADVGSGGLS